MTASKVKGYYHATGTTTALPLTSHPITYQQIGQDVWTHRPTNLVLDTEKTSPPPGLLIANTLSEPTTEKLIIGSDSLLHLHEQVAAAAWIISTGDTKHLSATFLMTNISSYTSHRIELEGIFRALHHLDLLNITPKMVEQWCDNEQAVKDSTTTLNGPSMMIKAEALPCTIYTTDFHSIQTSNTYMDTRTLGNQRDIITRTKLVVLWRQIRHQITHAPTHQTGPNQSRSPCDTPNKHPFTKGPYPSKYR